MLTQWSRMSVPLPKMFMVLNYVQLEQHFVGWLMKLGCRFVQFFDIMHKIGTASVTMFKSLQSQSKKVYGRRANMVVKLCYSLICELPLWNDKSTVLAENISLMGSVDMNLPDGWNHTLDIEQTQISDFSLRDYSQRDLLGSKNMDYTFQSLFRCMNNCCAEAKVRVRYIEKLQLRLVIYLPVVLLPYLLWSL